MLLAGGINILIAFVLLHNNYWYHDYGVYHRSRRLVALTYVIFGIGFLLHEHFEWRTSWPAAATALSLTYFHCAGVFFGWSHTSLLNPLYLNKLQMPIPVAAGLQIRPNASGGRCGAT